MYATLIFVGKRCEYGKASIVGFCRLATKGTS